MVNPKVFFNPDLASQSHSINRFPFRMPGGGDTRSTRETSEGISPFHSAWDWNVQGQLREVPVSCKRGEENCRTPNS